MNVAELMSQRGTCDRAYVGAVIAREGRILSTGYNGAPPGLMHCDENNHGWGDYTLVPVSDEAKEVMGCKNAIHAEVNALAFAARYGVSVDEASLYVTVAPCSNCSMLLIAAGISEVIYRNGYRNEDGIALLQMAGVEIRHEIVEFQ